jgi:1-acyl-sn-glycerol-3-phosphate acyltransferase
VHPPARSGRAYRTAAVFLRPVLKAVARRRWSGAERLPLDTGSIVVVNHVSNLDWGPVAHYLWDNGVAARFMAKDSLFHVPVVGPLLRGIEAIPVLRGTAAGARSLDAAEAAVRAGECVVVFPEGTLTRDPDLWPMRGKTGAARLAFATGAPVVPLAQWGAHQMLGQGHKLPRLLPRKSVTLVAGPPVDLDGLDGSTVEQAREATTRITRALTDLLAEVRGQTPPDGVWDQRLDGRGES